jgi:hypothetical protein
MSRVYTVAYQGTLTAAGTDSELFYLKPAADKPIRLRGFRLAQFSEIGDAQEENIRVSIIFLARHRHGIEHGRICGHAGGR